MNKIPVAAHAIIDYITAGITVSLPFLIHLPFGVTLFTFFVGSFHLMLTMFTAFDYALMPVIPFGIHGNLEIGESIALVIAGLIFALLGELTEFGLFITLSVIIFVSWKLTDYRNGKPSILD